MQIYFYCSYAHSRRGFFMTRLDGAQLVPQDEAQLPEEVSEFFSYARFRFLWREYGEFVQPDCPEPGMAAGYTPGAASGSGSGYSEPPQSERLKPGLVRRGAFLGFRELRGTLADGRSAAANLAILGDEAEVAAIRRIALEILSDVDSFEGQLISYLTVGGSCGYELDGEAFLAWLKTCSTHNVLHRAAGSAAGAGRLLRHLTGEPLSEPELIRLAACSYDWEQMRGYFGDGPQWKEQPLGVLSMPEFQELFRGHGTLWTMDEEQISSNRCKE